MGKGRRIVVGDSVEILSIHKSSAWFDRRGKIIGKVVVVDEYTPGFPIPGYAAISFDSGSHFIYGAKVRRVEV